MKLINCSTMSFREICIVCLFLFLYSFQGFCVGISRVITLKLKSAGWGHPFFQFLRLNFFDYDALFLTREKRLFICWFGKTESVGTAVFGKSFSSSNLRLAIHQKNWSKTNLGADWPHNYCSFTGSFVLEVWSVGRGQKCNGDCGMPRYFVFWFRF